MLEARSTACASPLCPPVQAAGHQFTRLRTGNEAPLDAESRLIREIISDGEERLGMLETHVRNLEAALADFVQKRDAAAKHLREHRAIILHPLRRTSPELICEIFAATLDHQTIRMILTAESATLLLCGR
ncbi:hypothetical protein C8R47DRAFT_1315792 [Mycena vitilis]|nr:hypothetical protein C8R47DRAFT_1315792 [Mycena vitilis]